MTRGGKATNSICTSVESGYAIPCTSHLNCHDLVVSIHFNHGGDTRGGRHTKHRDIGAYSYSVVLRNRSCTEYSVHSS